MLKKNIIEIAKIGKTIGFKGHLKLNILCSNDNVNVMKNKSIYYLSYNKDLVDWVLLKNYNICYTSKGIHILFNHVYNKEQAQSYVNTILGVHKYDLLPLNNNEYYYFNLIGCNVFNLNNYFFGKVIDIIDINIQQILLCQGGNKQYLIPFVKKYILSVDILKKIIVCDWLDED